MIANTVDTMDGLFKQVYSDEIVKLIPAAAKLQRKIPMVSKDQQEGLSFNQPVQLSRAAGWTLSTDPGAFALNPPQPSQSGNAQVQGSAFVLRDAISYVAAAKGLSGGTKKAQAKAFVNATSYVVENMTETAAFVQEILLLHGQRNIGVKNTRTNDSNTQQTFSITSATFIAAMWSGLEKGFVDLYTSGGVKINTADVQVIGVDVENQAVKLEGLEADLDAFNAATSPVFYLRGAKDAGMTGLITQVSNSGSLFGIDGSVYSLWQGNTFSAASGSMSFVKLIQALNKPVSRGLMSDVMAYCHPRTWTDCMNDLAALRRYSDKAGGKLEQGGSGLVFHGQAGSITLEPHIFMKPSELFAMPDGKAMRVGASDLTFQLPGKSEGKVWEDLPDHAGFGMRCFWHLGVLLPCPSQGLLVTGIVNSDDPA